MTGTSDHEEGAPSSGGFTVFAAAIRPELSRLAYLLTGHHATADDAVAGALREAAQAWSGPGPTAVDACRIALVRQALVLAEHLDRSQDDDFWRGGAWALQRLPADQRLIVALAAEPGLDEETTARLLGVPARVVHRRLRAGCASLGRHLKIPAAGGAPAVLDAVRVVAGAHRVGAASVMPVVPVVTGPVQVVADTTGTTGAPDGPPDDGAAAGDADVTTVGPGATAAREGRTSPRSPAGRLAVAAVALAVGGASLFWVLRPGSDGDVTLSSATPSASTPAAGPAAPTSPPPGVATPTTSASSGSPSRTAGTGTARRTVTKTAARGATRTAATTTRGTTTTGPRTRTTTTPPRTTTRTTRTTRTTTTTTTTRSVPGGLLLGRASNRCVEVPGGAGWGTQARLGDCVGGGGQTVSDGPGGSLRLAGLCLDDFNWGTSPGSLVVVWACSGQANQRWTIGGDGTIRSVHASALCIAAEGGGTGAGTRLVLLPCDGGPSQVWTRT